MGTSDQVQVIDLIELSCDSVAEKVASSSWGNSPSLDVLWIGPHQVGEWSLMWNLHSSVDKSDLVEGLDLWRETSVDAEDLALNDSGNAEIIEHFSAVSPWVWVTILAHGLFVETVDGGDSTSLVVSSQESDAVGILKLEAEEELEGLDGVVATVDEVSHEDVAGVWDLTSLFEKLEKIMELTVDVSANCNWGANRLDVALLDEDLLDLLAEETKVTFRQDSSLFDSVEPVVDIGS